MRPFQSNGAPGAPCPETMRRARVEARGVPASLAASVVAIAFAVPKRDDLAVLASVTASRCAAATGARL